MPTESSSSPYVVVERKIWLASVLFLLRDGVSSLVRVWASECRCTFLYFTSIASHSAAVGREIEFVFICTQKFKSSKWQNASSIWWIYIVYENEFGFARRKYADACMNYGVPLPISARANAEQSIAASNTNLQPTGFSANGWEMKSKSELHWKFSRCFHRTWRGAFISIRAKTNIDWRLLRTSDVWCVTYVKLIWNSL